MKTTHTIVITYWLLRAEPDRSSVEQIRALSAAGVYEAQFQAGEQKVMQMTARFDIDNPGATDAGVRYAIQNARAAQPGRIQSITVYIDNTQHTWPNSPQPTTSMNSPVKLAAANACTPSRSG